MKQCLVRAAALTGSIGVAACGAAPQMMPSAPANVLEIEITGVNGERSFSPNPSTGPPGQAIVWRNGDTLAHRIVFDDGELDTGEIAPGGASRTLPLVQPGGYHCAIHPSMVGTIQPPLTSLRGYLTSPWTTTFTGEKGRGSRSPLDSRADASANSAPTTSSSKTARRTRPIVARRQQLTPDLDAFRHQDRGYTGSVSKPIF
jgi:plastocyanin